MGPRCVLGKLEEWEGGWGFFIGFPGALDFSYNSGNPVGSRLDPSGNWGEGGQCREDPRGSCFEFVGRGWVFTRTLRFFCTPGFELSFVFC